MRRRSFRIAVAAFFVLTGCNALLDVKDIYLDPNGPGGVGSDGSTEGSTNQDGSTSTEGGSEGGTCVADLMTDPKNCGRCGRDCLGGNCADGKCDAVEIGFVADALLSDVVVAGAQVFVAPYILLTTDAGGIWRLPKTGGTQPELYVNIRYARHMVVVGNTLYFVVSDDPYDGATKTGGFYSCPLAGPAPCSPTRIAVADNPYGLTVDKGAIYYTDQTAGKGLMRYAPPALPATYRVDFGPPNLFVDDPTVFYTVSLGLGPQDVKLGEIFPDAGYIIRNQYTSQSAEPGRIIGTPDYVIYAAYDYAGTTGGVVRRYPRTGAVQACDYGGANNKRPYGLFSDTKTLFWTNQGEGADVPYTKGSVVSCDLAGCCAAPEVLWTGDGAPQSITGDTDALYFVTNSSHKVWRLAKP